jgi:hypothetical protein
MANAAKQLGPPFDESPAKPVEPPAEAPPTADAAEYEQRHTRRPSWLRRLRGRQGRPLLSRMRRVGAALPQ